VVGRIASFHLDRIDLSPVDVTDDDVLDDDCKDTGDASIANTAVSGETTKGAAVVEMPALPGGAVVVAVDPLMNGASSSASSAAGGDSEDSCPFAPGWMQKASQKAVGDFVASGMDGTDVFGDDGAHETDSDAKAAKQTNARVFKSVHRALRGTVETSVPEWVEQSRRLGGLLIGVSSTAGRPVSLAQEWAPIARRLLEDHERDDLTGVAGSGGGPVASAVAPSGVALVR
jgi:hypothetical protein